MTRPMRNFTQGELDWRPWVAPLISMPQPKRSLSR